MKQDLEQKLAVAGAVTGLHTARAVNAVKAVVVGAGRFIKNATIDTAKAVANAGKTTADYIRTKTAR